jgi:hypothetical protein
MVVIPLSAAFYAARLKCLRGGEILKHLQDHYSEMSKPAELITEYVAEGDYEILKLVVYPCSHAVPLIVGEIIHNFRCALDYLATSIVANITGNYNRRVGFTFHESRESFYNSRDKHQLYIHAPDVWEIIRTEFRPYSDHDGNRILWSLNKLWNQDKHRLLVLSTSVGVAAGNHQGRVDGVGNLYSFQGVGEFEIDRGFQVSHQMEVSSSLILIEPDIIGTVDLFQFLRQCFEVTAIIGKTLEAHFFGDNATNKN